MVLPEASLFPVDLVVQAAPQGTLLVPVFFQRSRINLDLPSGAAGIRTRASGALKFIPVMGNGILHVTHLFLFCFLPVLPADTQ